MKSTNATAFGNGTRSLPGKADGRSLRGRRVRELIAALTEEFGGEDKLSVVDRGIVLMAASSLAIAEELAGAFVDHREGTDLVSFTHSQCRASSEAAKLLNQLRESIAERRKGKRGDDPLAPYKAKAAELGLDLGFGNGDSQ